MLQLASGQWPLATIVRCISRNGMLYRNSSNLPIPIIKFNKPVKAVRFFHSFSTEKNIASKPADRRLLATAQQIDNLLRNAEEELQHKTTISILVIEMSENASILESRQLSWRGSKQGSFQPSHIWNNIDFGRQFKGVISPSTSFWLPIPCCLSRGFGRRRWEWARNAIKSRASKLDEQDGFRLAPAII